MNKPIIHNRLVRLWGNPTRAKFQQFYSTYGLFNDSDDAQNLIKFGAYLIITGNRKASEIKPYNPQLGLENWVNSVEGDILFHVGIE